MLKTVSSHLAAVRRTAALFLLLASINALQAHVIVICKRSDSTNPVSGVFQFTVTGLAQTFYVAAGQCSEGIIAPSGSATLTITEQATTGTELISVSVDPASEFVAANLTARTVTIKTPAETATVTVYFKNRHKGGTQGCTPGFWKNHLGAWVVYSPDANVKSVFSNATLDLTLLQALQGGGGPGLAGAQQILLRAAVAALLNAANSDVSYPLTTSQVIAQVNTALTGDRETMLQLAGSLDASNNGAGGCPLGGPETR